MSHCLEVHINECYFCPKEASTVLQVEILGCSSGKVGNSCVCVCVCVWVWIVEKKGKEMRV